MNVLSKYNINILGDSNIVIGDKVYTARMNDKAKSDGYKMDGYNPIQQFRIEEYRGSPVQLCLAGLGWFKGDSVGLGVESLNIPDEVKEFFLKIVSK